jgi:hypothetical protein
MAYAQSRRRSDPFSFFLSRQHQLHAYIELTDDDRPASDSPCNFSLSEGRVSSTLRGSQSTTQFVSRSVGLASMHMVMRKHSEENHLRNVVQRHIALMLEVCFCYTGSSGPGARFHVCKMRVTVESFVSEAPVAHLEPGLMRVIP